METENGSPDEIEIVYLTRVFAPLRACATGDIVPLFHNFLGKVEHKKQQKIAFSSLSHAHVLSFQQKYLEIATVILGFCLPQ